MVPMLRGHTCSSFNQNPKNLMNDKNAKNVINDKNERRIARGARGRAAGPAADSPAGLPQAAADQGLVSRGSWVQPPPPAVLWRGRRRPLPWLPSVSSLGQVGRRPARGLPAGRRFPLRVVALDSELVPSPGAPSSFPFGRAGASVSKARGERVFGGARPARGGLTPPLFPLDMSSS